MDPKCLKPVRGKGPDPKYGAPSIVKSVRMPGTLWDDLCEIALRDDTSANELIVRTMMRKVSRELR